MRQAKEPVEGEGQFVRTQKPGDPFPGRERMATSRDIIHMSNAALDRRSDSAEHLLDFMVAEEDEWRHRAADDEKWAAWSGLNGLGNPPTPNEWAWAIVDRGERRRRRPTP